MRTELKDVDQLTEQDIIQTARQQFFEKGTKSVKMDDIATELGMSKKTLYQHFNSKNELISRVLKEFTEEMETKFDLLTQEQISYSERFERAVKLIIEGLSQIKPIFLEDITRSRVDHFKIIRRFREEKIPLVFKNILIDGQNSGLVRSDINLDIAIASMLSSIQSLVTPEFIMKSQIGPAEIFENIIKLTNHGILKREL
jgi:AcrR family transcriptional regulator